MTWIRRLSFLILLQVSPSCGSGGDEPAAEPTPGTTLDLTEVFVPSECAGRTIAIYPTASDLTPPRAPANPEISQVDQLSVFETAVTVVANEYFHPDFDLTEWETNTVAIIRTEIQSGIDTETFYSKMSVLITALGDGQSQFLSPTAVQATSAEFSGMTDFMGFGVLMQSMPERNNFTILVIFPDSPAERGGLLPHDSVLSVNDIPLVEGGAAYAWRLDGPECSGAVLTVHSPGQTQRNLGMVRSHHDGSARVYERLVDTADGSRIGYIFIQSFYGSTISDQVREALQALGRLDGLILDCRMNRGGGSPTQNLVLGYFTSGTVGHFVGRMDSRSLDIVPNPVNDSQSVPLIVLVGEDTRDSGELFAGILQDVGRAQIVGQATRGNVEIVHLHEGSDGSRVWFAAERFVPINSEAVWEKSGIVPDVEAFADWDTFTFENDPAVSAAVELLAHR